MTNDVNGKNDLSDAELEKVAGGQEGTGREGSRRVLNRGAGSMGTENGGASGTPGSFPNGSDVPRRSRRSP